MRGMVNFLRAEVLADVVRFDHRVVNIRSVSYGPVCGGLRARGGLEMDRAVVGMVVGLLGP